MTAHWGKTLGGARAAAVVAFAFATGASVTAMAQTAYEIPWGEIGKGRLYVSGNAAFSYARNLHMKGNFSEWGSDPYKLTPWYHVNKPAYYFDRPWANHGRTTSRQTYNIGIGYYFNDSIHLEVAYGERMGYKLDEDFYHDPDLYDFSLYEGNWNNDGSPYHTDPDTSPYAALFWDRTLLLSEPSRVRTLMVNLYKNLKPIAGFTPYVGAGVGIGYTKIGALTRYMPNNEQTPQLSMFFPETSQTGAVFQFMTGLNYRRSDDFDINIGYRYAYLGDFLHKRRAYYYYPDWLSVKGDYEGEVVQEGAGTLRVHEFTVGTRYNF